MKKLIYIALVLILSGVLVTHYLGVQGSVLLRKARPEIDFYDKDYKAHRMPFSVKLDYYIEDSLSGNYTSSITIKSKQKQNSFDISMNSSLRYKGYRFSQSSHDPAGKKMVLSVSYNPWGKLLTYTGCCVLFLGLVLMSFTKPQNPPC